MEADRLRNPSYYPEGSDYLAEYIRNHKLAEYLELIKESKKICTIPVIASINCYTDAEWVDFAKQIEEAGADALEINILALQSVSYTHLVRLTVELAFSLQILLRILNFPQCVKSCFRLHAVYVQMQVTGWTLQGIGCQ